jgi:hypothetical protein
MSKLLNIVVALYLCLEHGWIDGNDCEMRPPHPWYYIEHKGALCGKVDFLLGVFGCLSPHIPDSVYLFSSWRLQRLADFKACILSPSLYTISIGPPTKVDVSRLRTAPQFQHTVFMTSRNCLRLLCTNTSVCSTLPIHGMSYFVQMMLRDVIQVMQNDIVKRLNVLFLIYRCIQRYGFVGEKLAVCTNTISTCSNDLNSCLFKYYRTPQPARLVEPALSPPLPAGPACLGVREYKSHMP